MVAKTTKRSDNSKDEEPDKSSRKSSTSSQSTGKTSTKDTEPDIIKKDNKIDIDKRKQAILERDLRIKARTERMKARLQPSSSTDPTSLPTAEKKEKSPVCKRKPRKKYKPSPWRIPRETRAQAKKRKQQEQLIYDDPKAIKQIENSIDSTPKTTQNKGDSVNTRIKSENPDEENPDKQDLNLEPIVIDNKIHPKTQDRENPDIPDPNPEGVMIRGEDKDKPKQLWFSDTTTSTDNTSKLRKRNLRGDPDKLDLKPQIKTQLITLKDNYREAAIRDKRGDPDILDRKPQTRNQLKTQKDNEKKLTSTHKRGDPDIVDRNPQRRGDPDILDRNAQSQLPNGHWNTWTDINKTMDMIQDECDDILIVSPQTETLLISQESRKYGLEAPRGNPDNADQSSQTQFHPRNQSRGDPEGINPNSQTQNQQTEGKMENKGKWIEFDITIDMIQDEDEDVLICSSPEPELEEIQLQPSTSEIELKNTQKTSTPKTKEIEQNWIKSLLLTIKRGMTPFGNKQRNVRDNPRTDKSICSNNTENLDRTAPKTEKPAPPNAEKMIAMEFGVDAMLYEGVNLSENLMHFDIIDPEILSILEDDECGRNCTTHGCVPTDARNARAPNKDTPKEKQMREIENSERKEDEMRTIGNRISTQTPRYRKIAQKSSIIWKVKGKQKHRKFSRKKLVYSSERRGERSCPNEAQLILEAPRIDNGEAIFKDIVNTNDQLIAQNRTTDKKTKSEKKKKSIDNTGKTSQTPKVDKKKKGDLEKRCASVGKRRLTTDIPNIVSPVRIDPKLYSDKRITTHTSLKKVKTKSNTLIALEQQQKVTTEAALEKAKEVLIEAQKLNPKKTVLQEQIDISRRLSLGNWPKAMEKATATPKKEEEMEGQEERDCDISQVGEVKEDKEAAAKLIIKPEDIDKVIEEVNQDSISKVTVYINEQAEMIQKFQWDRFVITGQSPNEISSDFMGAATHHYTIDKAQDMMSASHNKMDEGLIETTKKVAEIFKDDPEKSSEITNKLTEATTLITQFTASTLITIDVLKNSVEQLLLEKSQMHEKQIRIIEELRIAKTEAQQRDKKLAQLMQQRMDQTVSINGLIGDMQKMKVLLEELSGPDRQPDVRTMPKERWKTTDKIVGMIDSDPFNEWTYQMILYTPEGMESDQDMPFLCIRHLMIYRRALYFGDIKLATSIRHAKKLRDVFYLDRIMPEAWINCNQLEEWPEIWAGMYGDAVLNLVEFEAHVKILLRELVEDADTEIFLASTDMILGTGTKISMESDIFTYREQPGRNLGGQILRDLSLDKQREVLDNNKLVLRKAQALKEKLLLTWNWADSTETQQERDIRIKAVIKITAQQTEEMLRFEGGAAEQQILVQSWEERLEQDEIEQRESARREWEKESSKESVTKQWKSESTSSVTSDTSSAVPSRHSDRKSDLNWPGISSAHPKEQRDSKYKEKETFAQKRKHDEERYKKARGRSEKRDKSKDKHLERHKSRHDSKHRYDTSGRTSPTYANRTVSQASSYQEEQLLQPISTRPSSSRTSRDVSPERKYRKGSDGEIRTVRVIYPIPKRHWCDNRVSNAIVMRDMEADEIERNYSTIMRKLEYTQTVPSDSMYPQRSEKTEFTMKERIEADRGPYGATWGQYNPPKVAPVDKRLPTPLITRDSVKVPIILRQNYDKGAGLRFGIVGDTEAGSLHGDLVEVGNGMANLAERNTDSHGNSRPLGYPKIRGGRSNGYTGSSTRMRNLRGLIRAMIRGDEDVLVMRGILDMADILSFKITKMRKIRETAEFERRMTPIQVKERDEAARRENKGPWIPIDENRALAALDRQILGYIQQFAEDMAEIATEVSERNRHVIIMWVLTSIITPAENCPSDPNDPWGRGLANQIQIEFNRQKIYLAENKLARVLIVKAEEAQYDMAVRLKTPFGNWEGSDNEKICLGQVSNGIKATPNGRRAISIEILRELYSYWYRLENNQESDFEIAQRQGVRMAIVPREDRRTNKFGQSTSSQGNPVLDIDPLNVQGSQLSGPKLFAL